MPITAKENSKPRELIPEGLHSAICYLVVDIGTHFNPTFGKAARKVIVGWEFTDIRMESEDDNRPKVKSKTMTLSLHEKAILRKTLESWRGSRLSQVDLAEGFDISKLLGVNCQLQIIHEENNGKTYDNIANVLPPKSGKIEVVNTENAHSYFSFEEDMEIPFDLHEWIAELIKKSKEYNEVDEEEPAHLDDGPPINDDDIPF
jgi:hypothetical protein